MKALFFRIFIAAALLSGIAPLARANQASQAISPKAIEALDLVASGDSYKQQLGFLRLEALREPATIAALLPYTTDKDPELRSGSVRCLAAVEGIEAVPMLLDKIENDRDGRVVRAAMLGAEPFIEIDPRILPLLIKRLTHHDKTVCMAAVDIISRSKDPSAREAILFRYKREGRRDVRRVLDLAMTRMGAR